MNLFRKISIELDPVVRRSSLTIREALEAASHAGTLTPDTGLFERWLRAKGLSSRGSVLIERMRKEYEQAFEERFNGQIAFSQKHAELTSPHSGNCPIIIRQPADGRKLNREFLERQKGGDANCFVQCAEREVTGYMAGVAPPYRSQNLRTSKEGGSNPPSIPSPDSISALYASGKASSLKEALAILGGGR